MRNLLKVIIIYSFLQWINGDLINMKPKDWNDVIFDAQYGDNYCFSYVRPLLNHLKRVNKKIDAHDALEEELKHIKLKLKERDANEKAKQDLLNGKNKEIKELKDLVNLNVEKIMEQFKKQNDKHTENSKQMNNLKDFINAMAKQLKKELKDVLTQNNKQINENFDNSLNAKVTNVLLKTKDEQINELKNTIKENNEQIADLRTQMSKESKILAEKTQQLMIYNQQKENLPNMGLYVDEVKRIQFAGQPAFDVSFISPLSPLSAWIVIQRRMDGSVDFERDWIDYKEGFGNKQGEFFLGLEKLHIMMQSKPHELFIEMRDVSGTTKYAHFDNFKVASEKENFKLISIGNYNGTAGNSLRQHVGFMFTTQDRDNDIETTGNCAIGRGGWWHHDCSHSCLNGKYNKNGISVGVNGIVWGSFKNWNYSISLTFTQMMIRPTL